MNKKIFKKYAAFLYCCYKFNKYAKECVYNRVLDAGIYGNEFKLYIWLESELGHLKLHEAYYVDLDQNDGELKKSLSVLIDVYNREAKKMFRFNGQRPGRSFEWSMKDFAKSLES